jgi:starvation-inducible outer membrane lipoprotein
MKNKAIGVLACSLALLLLTGCIAAIGNGESRSATVGQQLVDLQKAKDAGALTEAEFQEQKAKLLRGNKR